MANIVFFSLPAHGHTNPTIAVVRELVQRGHQVWYYSFAEFEQRIREAGAEFVGCDRYLPPLRPQDEKKVGKDFSMLVTMTADTAIAMQPDVCAQLEQLQPDCVVCDSVCLWGKLFAKRLGLPLVCSTTTFAFNKQTIRYVKRSFSEVWTMVKAGPVLRRKEQELHAHGFVFDGFISLLDNDNQTDTIVYTAREFQLLPETFSERFAFVGPSLQQQTAPAQRSQTRPSVYISLGTVLNRNSAFYRNCLEALGGCDCTVILSVGDKTDIEALGQIPGNCTVLPRVDQQAVLAAADVFVTHCGMNSVNEAIWYGVPLVMFPQHSEEQTVATRAQELGLGVQLRNSRPATIRAAVQQVLADSSYRRQAEQLSSCFHRAGGAVAAANHIEKTVAAAKG